MSDVQIIFGDLVAMLGERADKLLFARAGRYMDIPHAAGPYSPLVMILGQRDADLVAAHFGGKRVYVPSLRARHAFIVGLRAQGMTVAAIAARLHCSIRTVYIVLAAHHEAQAHGDANGGDPRQMDLPFPA